MINSPVIDAPFIEMRALLYESSLILRILPTRFSNRCGERSDEANSQQVLLAHAALPPLVVQLRDSCGNSGTGHWLARLVHDSCCRSERQSVRSRSHRPQALHLLHKLTGIHLFLRLDDNPCRHFRFQGAHARHG